MFCWNLFPFENILQEDIGYFHWALVTKHVKLLADDFYSFHLINQVFLQLAHFINRLFLLIPGLRWYQYTLAAPFEGLFDLEDPNYMWNKIGNMFLCSYVKMKDSTTVLLFNLLPYLFYHGIQFTNFFLYIFNCYFNWC